MRRLPWKRRTSPLHCPRPNFRDAWHVAKVAASVGHRSLSGRRQSSDLQGRRPLLALSPICLLAPDSGARTLCRRAAFRPVRPEPDLEREGRPLPRRDRRSVGGDRPRHRRLEGRISGFARFGVSVSRHRMADAAADEVAGAERRRNQAGDIGRNDCASQGRSGFRHRRRTSGADGISLRAPRRARRRRRVGSRSSATGARRRTRSTTFRIMSVLTSRRRRASGDTGSRPSGARRRTVDRPTPSIRSSDVRIRGRGSRPRPCRSDGERAISCRWTIEAVSAGSRVRRREL